ncbi:DUF1850 domain-containing protein [Mesorhizobium sp. M8A.F.Ca.ET.057.01.1.1]|nr:DUF1850 domain-containing protein [Mesorhizobium sp. M8A.F.Ca.ET.057.01.1.1]RWE47892.1 MAG: DUF1850 domain-containing protein [Mesorhizobium sp.]
MRFKGSGAGMEPPEGAGLRDGWWIYAPKVGAQRRVMLAASGATGDGWTLCTDGFASKDGKGGLGRSVTLASAAYVL